MSCIVPVVALMIITCVLTIAVFVIVINRKEILPMLKQYINDFKDSEPLIEEDSKQIDK